MQILHFVYGLGCILGPILAMPFLKENLMPQKTDEMTVGKTRPDTGSLEYVNIIWGGIADNVTDTSSNPEENTNVHFDHYGVLNVMFNMTDTFLHGNRGLGENASTVGSYDEETDGYGYEYIFYTCAGGLALLALLFFFVWATQRMSIFSHKEKPKFRNTLKKTDKDKKQTCIQTLIAICMAIFHFLYLGTEVAYCSLVFSFAVEGCDWSKEDATHITSMVFCAMTIGQCLGISLASYVSESVILGTNLIVMIVAFTVELCLHEDYPTILWITSVVTGIGMSTVLPASLTWLERRLPITGRLATWMTISSTLGIAVISGVTGTLMQHVGMQSFDVFLLSVTAVNVLLLTVIFNLGKRLKTQHVADNESMFRHVTHVVSPHGDAMENQAHRRPAMTTNMPNTQSKASAVFKVVTGAPLRRLRYTYPAEAADCRAGWRGFPISPYLMNGITPLSLVIYQNKH